MQLGCGLIRKSPILEELLLIPPKRVARIRSISDAAERSISEVATSVSREVAGKDQDASRKLFSAKIKKLVTEMGARLFGNLNDDQLEQLLGLLLEPKSLSEFIESLEPESRVIFDNERSRIE